jgi:hypothetical protein
LSFNFLESKGLAFNLHAILNFTPFASDSEKLMTKLKMLKNHSKNMAIMVFLFLIIFEKRDVFLVNEVKINNEKLNNAKINNLKAIKKLMLMITKIHNLKKIVRT